MAADIDAIMESIADHVWARVPSYPAMLLGPDELRSRVQESVTIVIGCLLESRPPSAAELERAANTGERRALQSVDPIAMVQSFRQAERLLGDAFQSLCARMQVRGPVARAGREKLIADLDAMEAAMLEGFSRMQEQIAVNTAIAEPALMRRLAQGDRVTFSEVAQLAGAMGLTHRTEDSFVGAALAPLEPMDDTDLARLRHRIVVQMSAAVQENVLSGTVTAEAGEIIVFAVPWTGEITRLAQLFDDAIGIGSLPVEMRAALGDPQQGLIQVGLSCQHAIAAIAAAHSQPPRTTVLYRDTLLEIVARSDLQVARSLYERYLAPLQSQPYLLETLRCHLDNDLAVAETARLLHVHKNTVGYRIRRIQDLTGLDLRIARDVARAVVALECMEVLTSPVVNADPPAAHTG